MSSLKNYRIVPWDAVDQSVFSRQSEMPLDAK